MRFISTILFCFLGSSRFDLPTIVEAFTTVTTPKLVKPFTSFHRVTFLRASADNNDDEIERLRSMAAKLRAEAATLEAEKAQVSADAAEKAFRQFDTDNDGNVGIAELKAGLEKVLKTELSESRVKKIMEAFDATGDGALQIDEFVSIDKFRNRLEALVREEKENAMDAKKKAKIEEDVAAIAMARLELINDKPPTPADKVLSTIPYLFPLLDGLQFARVLIFSQDGSTPVDNPIVAIVVILYALYRTIPFSGFIAFFALNFLSGNPRINRLIRFNMQQAIFVDIALFFPGLFSGISSLIAGGGGVQIPAAFGGVVDTAVFATLILTLTYAVASSLLGIMPDKIPIISKAALDRMPSADMFTVDKEGRIVPKDDFRSLGGDEDDKDKKKDKK